MAKFICTGTHYYNVDCIETVGKGKNFDGGFYYYILLKESKSPISISEECFGRLMEALDII